MNEFFALIITFLFALILIIPVMVIAFWPEKYHIIKKTHRKLIDVGRNDPCPCGSGKKYKKCCSTMYNGLYMVDRWHIPRKD